MYRAVNIAGSLTTAIQNILKGPTINMGRHGQALKKLAKMFETATENLETQQQKVHKPRRRQPRTPAYGHTKGACSMTCKQTSYHTNPTTHINSKYWSWQRVFPPIADSEGGQRNVRERNSKNERETRHENRERAKKLNEKCKADSSRGTHNPNRTSRKRNPKTIILNTKNNQPGGFDCIFIGSGRDRNNTPPHKIQPGLHYKDIGRNSFPREHPTFLCASNTSNNGQTHHVLQTLGKRPRPERMIENRFWKRVGELGPRG